jgi:hypothetical protein
MGNSLLSELLVCGSVVLVALIAAVLRFTVGKDQPDTPDTTLL